jgi:homoserine dehydrogenase
MDDHEGPVYVRLMVLDQPGVMADVAAILRDENVSIESVLQRGRSPGEVVPVILILHDAREGAMKRVLVSLEAMAPVVEPPRMIRIELL